MHRVVCILFLPIALGTGAFQALLALLIVLLTRNCSTEIELFLKEHVGFADGHFERLRTEQQQYWDELHAVFKCCGLKLGSMDWQPGELPPICRRFHRGCVPVLVEHTRRMGNLFVWVAVGNAIVGVLLFALECRRNRAEMKRLKAPIRCETEIIEMTGINEYIQ